MDSLRKALSLASALLVWAVAAAAGAAGGGASSVAIAGDAAPGTAGGTYAFFGTPAVNPGGNAVVFRASVENAAVGSGVFLHAEASHSAVALEGDPAPGSGAGTYSGFGNPSINGSGDVAFLATVTGGTVTRGIFVDAGGTQTAIALTGDAAPGAGGTYSSFGDPSINGSGETAFFAVVSGGSASAGMFIDSGGSQTAVALVGDLAPGAGGGTYAGFGDHSLNASGDLAFFASISGGTVSSGIFLASGGTHTTVALAGDPAPGTGGGTYLGFADPSLNASSGVAFLATVTGGTVNRGVFFDSGGIQTAIALEGDPAPGTGGGTYFFFGSPVLVSSGDVAFRANLSGGTVGQAIFVDSGGTQAALALAGDPAPDSGGGSYSFFDRPRIVGSEAVFRANLVGGTASQGIFAAASESPAPVPGLSIHGLVLVALAIAVLGGIGAGRRPIHGTGSPRWLRFPRRRAGSRSVRH